MGRELNEKVSDVLCMVGGKGVPREIWWSAFGNALEICVSGIKKRQSFRQPMYLPSSGTNATRETRDAFERYSYSPIPSNLDLCRVRTKELYIRILMVQQRNDQAPCLWPLLELEKFVLEAFQVIRRCGGRRGSICLFDELQNVDKVGASDKD
jgi:hypothetical protein